MTGRTGTFAEYRLNQIESAIKKALLDHEETMLLICHSKRLAKAVEPVAATEAPSADEIRRKRDDAVMSDYNGRNREEVMLKHNISRRLFYSILARHNARK